MLAMIPYICLDNVQRLELLVCYGRLKWTCCSFKIVYKRSVSNRRCILSTTNSIYDLLRFLSPFMQLIIVLQQDPCRAKLSGDNTVDEQSQKQIDE